MFWYRLKYQGLMDYWGSTQGVHVAVLILSFVAVAAVAYLLGSLNFALIISKLKFHDDIRRHGSGNAGMTNMLRTYGKAAAVFTLLGDAAKAAVAIIVGALLNGMIGAYIAGFFCILGHMYPAYYKFKGGKGVVTSAVLVLMLDWRVFLVLFAIFLLIVASTKYVSLGSIMGMLIYPLLLYNFNGPGINILFAFAISALVIFKHRDNIRRLLEQRENKISFGIKKTKTNSGGGKSD
ncbi:MAG: glycerol-3-phosphate 1-O-acyltransferase PlsY [Clostridiales bacterium]|nr:glycerol-3-phosphate 1-O-acyltransferase PlsY [Clostridiales bacterium]